MLVDTISKHRLGLKDVEPDILGEPMNTCLGSSLKEVGKVLVSFTPQ